MGLSYVFQGLLFGLTDCLLVALRGLSCSAACEVLVPQPRIKPTSPALKGRFLTTGPPGKFLGLPIFKEDIISRQGILKVWWSKGVGWSLALRHVFCPCFFWCLEKVLRASPMTWVFVTLFRLLLRCFNFEWHFCNFEFHLTLNSIPFPEDHCYKDLTPPTQTGPLPPSDCLLLSAAPCSPPHPSGPWPLGRSVPPRCQLLGNLSCPHTQLMQI